MRYAAQLFSGGNRGLITSRRKVLLAVTLDEECKHADHRCNDNDRRGERNRRDLLVCWLVHAAQSRKVPKIFGLSIQPALPECSHGDRKSQEELEEALPPSQDGMQQTKEDDDQRVELHEHEHLHLSNLKDCRILPHAHQRGHGRCKDDEAVCFPEHELNVGVGEHFVKTGIGSSSLDPERLAGDEQENTEHRTEKNRQGDLEGKAAIKHWNVSGTAAKLPGKANAINLPVHHPDARQIRIPGAISHATEVLTPLYLGRDVEFVLFSV